MPCPDIQEKRFQSSKETPRCAIFPRDNDQPGAFFVTFGIQFSAAAQIQYVSGVDLLVV
jgi:hypothetical protein